MNTDDDISLAIKEYSRKTLIITIAAIVLLLLLWYFRSFFHLKTGGCIALTLLIALAVGAQTLKCHLLKKFCDPLWLSQQQALLEERKAHYLNWDAGKHGDRYPLTDSFRRYFLLTAGILTIAFAFLFLYFWTNIEIFMKLAFVLPLVFFIPITMFLQLPSTRYIAEFKNDIPKIKILNLIDLKKLFKEEELSEEVIGPDPYRKDLYDTYHLMLRYSKFWISIFLISWPLILVVAYLKASS